jgi:hypothetical protein
MVKGGGGEGEGGGGCCSQTKVGMGAFIVLLGGRGTFIMAEVGGGTFLVTIYLLRVKKGG